MDAATGRQVLLYPEGIEELNPTAHEIVARCDGNTSVETIIAALAAEYETEAETLQGDVLECLQELLQRKLLVPAP